MDFNPSRALLEMTLDANTADASFAEPTLSIIVVSFNTRGLLGECLRSIGDCKGEVCCDAFVVDNASNDGTVEFVREAFPWVQVIANSQNLGFSKANNQALRACKGRYALLLNSDALLHPHALAGMVSFLETHPNTGMVSCRLVDGSGRTQPSAGNLPGLWSQFVSFFEVRRFVPRAAVETLVRTRWTKRLLRALSAGYFTPMVQSSAPISVRFLSGACLMVRRELYEQIGLLDENIFLFLEDADWCLRASEAGWNLYYLPDYDVTHLGGRSFLARSGGRDYRISVERCESILYYFGKHYGKLGRFSIRVVIGLSLSLRLLTLWVRRLFGGRDRAEYVRSSALYREILTLSLRK